MPEDSGSAYSGGKVARHNDDISQCSSDESASQASSSLGLDSDCYGIGYACDTASRTYSQSGLSATARCTDPVLQLARERLRGNIR
jgi:hypothetical protein